MPNECNDLIPSLCGGSRLPTFVNAPCHHVYFTGLEELVVSQGSTVDLEQGVHAYDKNDNEIIFAYTPASIDTSVLGEYVVAYTAIGEGDTPRPITCGGMSLHVTDCNHEIVTKYRKVIVITGGTKVCEAIVCESSLEC